VDCDRVGLISSPGLQDLGTTCRRRHSGTKSMKQPLKIHSFMRQKREDYVRVFCNTQVTVASRSVSVRVSEINVMLGV